MKVVATVVALIALTLTTYVKTRADADAEPFKGSLGQSTPPRIAFTRMREDVDRANSDYRVEAEIWMMNADGGQQLRLTRNTTDDLGAVWSPDGKTIAFYGVQFTPDAGGRLVAGSPHIFLIDVETRLQRPLLTDGREPVRGRFPSWSPDGRTIAFDTGGPEANIAVIHLDGTGFRQLTHDVRSRHTRPDWSPDGRIVAFARGPVGSEQIYVMNADGSGLVALTDLKSRGHATAPDWSPDGQRIVFQSNRDSIEPASNDQIYVMNADGSNQRRLTNTASRDVDPDWSPDGAMIAFERANAPRNIDQVFVMSADGGEPSALTALPGASGHPAWDRARNKQ
jgi:Tol biopolymer transport system component